MYFIFSSAHESRWSLTYLSFSFIYCLLQIFMVVRGYKSIMENCMENARFPREEIAKTGRFVIISKDVCVLSEAFALKDGNWCTVFQILESLRMFGWIVPAYTMPPDAEHIAVLRVVIREDFSHTLAERLVSDIQKVLKELDELPPRVSTKAAHVSVVADETQSGNVDQPHLKKSDVETQKEISNYWRRISDKKTSGVC